MFTHLLFLLYPKTAGSALSIEQIRQFFILIFPYSSAFIFAFISSICFAYFAIGFFATQIIKTIPVNVGAPNFKKFNANIALSGCCPIAPATYPEAASTARIPELTTVLPHFCANPLIEAITAFADFLLLTG